MKEILNCQRCELCLEHTQQRKKGEGVSLLNSLETRNNTGEEYNATMPVDVDNHAVETDKCSFKHKGDKNTDKKCKLSIKGKCTGNFSPLKCDGVDTPKECKKMLNTQPKYASAISGSHAEKGTSSLESRYDSKKVENMNVLSLFDGISSGQVALERAGIKINKYFASEIDKHAIKITQKNYPNTIQLGDITKIDTTNLPEIDFLIGGSPCQSFSNAGSRTGFSGESGLFWKFVEILKEVKPKYFLLENVKMKQEWRDIITKALGVESVEIDSALVSAQQRKRNYWTNIPLDKLKIKDRKIYLNNILGIEVEYNEDRIIMSKSDFDVKVRKYYINKIELCKYLRSFKNKTIKEIADFCDVPLTKAEHWFRLDNSFAIPDEESWFKLKELFCINSDKYDKEITEFEIKRNNFDMAKRIYDIKGKHPTLTTLTGGHQRKTISDGEDMFYLTPEHAEELQTLPIGYTEGLSDNQRFKAIGNGWTVDIIAEILKCATLNLNKEKSE